ncbi:sulfonate ABC transporter substrate-binding protein [Bacillus methanolicus]|uniref:sulfonate ABC transporter substrate-binding protein n=1 Tax=Bacillus methanolicus TaxID=1471 RepID=UPI002380028C|nr:sulfonate ABC transporter substrate-binding protein [Bacillus methanolicus]MDE3838954.1 sulfonate ABC transporter substrate-binding protein [Bacillus methanolicus]
MKRNPFKLVFIFISLLVLLAGCGSESSGSKPEEEKQNSQASTEESETKVVRIGYQKGNTLNILKAKGNLEERFKEKGIKVEWSPFPTGSVLLEALNAGSIDFGHASDGNSVFAQASGKPIVYIASESPYPKGVAIVVKKDSPIQSIRDLKGKKVAVTKGGNQQYLLVKALEKEGLKYEDVTPVYYKDAAEGRVAFESGKIDALGIWDPFLAVIENDLDVREITNGEGLTENRTYYFASEKFSKEKPDLIKIILEELEKSNQWANENPNEVAKILSDELKIDEKAIEIATKRREYGILKIDEQAIKSQQELADTFFELGLMPNDVNVEESIEKDPDWLPDIIK